MKTRLFTLLFSLLFISAIALAEDYEVWALDQGTNTLYIITPELTVSEVIPLPEEIVMPHMVDFSSDFAHAFIANVTSGNTAVIRTSDREVVAVLDTGAGTHMASVSRQDHVIVDVLGDIDRVPGALVEIVWDAEGESFEIGRSLVIREDPLFAELTEAGHLGRPVCHDYTADGRYAYVTLGPALTDAVLVVLDVERFELVKVFDPEDVRANCGTMLSPDGSRMFVNGGSVGEGLWYVFDPETHELLHEDLSRGTDAHGVWFTPDGSELWMVNRHSSNAIIINPETLEIVEEIGFVGQSPDILTISPDNRYAFITLRGPEPLSGPHAIAGETPGVAVLDVATREIVTILEPDQGNPNSDFHGIGLRQLTP